MASASREAFQAGSHGVAGNSRVPLMLHTFFGTDRHEAREIVRKPFSDYLRSASSLIARSFERYFDTGGFFDTVEDGLRTLDTLAELGVDEVACLIDFAGSTNSSDESGGAAVGGDRGGVVDTGPMGWFNPLASLLYQRR